MNENDMEIYFAQTKLITRFILIYSIPTHQNNLSCLLLLILTQKNIYDIISPNIGLNLFNN